MKLKLVNVDVSSIERTDQDLIFHFEKNALIVSNFLDYKFGNSEPFSIHCSKKEDSFNMTCDEMYILLTTINTIDAMTILHRTERLLENETFKLLMHINFEEFYEADMEKLVAQCQ